MTIDKMPLNSYKNKRSNERSMWSSTAKTSCKEAQIFFNVSDFIQKQCNDGNFNNTYQEKK